ncbi:MAG TPA: hypothetical protein VFY49_02865 [Myxococcota bacterium]|nr:hypothetical protein [Myxococcota bacterium]
MSHSHPGTPPKPKLYSASGIDVATFFGSWLAGAILISRNFSRLGNPDAARNAIIIGAAGTIALAFVALSLAVPASAERALQHGFQAVQVAVIHLVVSRAQGAPLKEHTAAGGEYFSRWRALGISLLVFPIAVVLVLGVAYLFPNLPALGE